MDAPIEFRFAAPGDSWYRWSDDHDALRVEYGQVVLRAMRADVILGSALLEVCCGPRAIDLVFDREVAGPFLRRPCPLTPIALLVDSLWVSPDLRGSGWGSQMIQHVGKLGMPTYGIFADPRFARFCQQSFAPRHDIDPQIAHLWSAHQAYLARQQAAPERVVEIDLRIASAAQMFDGDAVAIVNYALRARDGLDQVVEIGLLDARRSGDLLSAHVSISAISAVLRSAAHLAALRLRPHMPRRPLCDLDALTALLSQRLLGLDARVERVAFA